MLEKNLTQTLLGRKLKFLKSSRYRRGYLWDVEKVREEFEVCPKCANTSRVQCGKVSVVVREESLRTDFLWLRIHKHRYYCKVCRKPFTEAAPGVWPRRRTTQRFRRSVARSCDDMTDLSRVRRVHRVSTGFLYELFYEQQAIKLRERDNQPWPEAIGIDEHFFKRKKIGTEFVTVITNLKKRRLFEVALGKDKKSLIEQLKSIPGRENVKVVAIDMSDTYRSFVKTFFPNAIIVADKFHVLRLISPALIKERSQIHGPMQDLKWRRLLLRNYHRLDYDVRCDLKNYLEKHPTLKELHTLKEQLHSFYRTKGIARAVKSFNRLMKALEAATHERAKSLRRTLSSWKKEILLYFENGYTNALTEGLNNRAKLLQRRAYGYKSFKNYRLRLLNACGF